MLQQSAGVAVVSVENSTNSQLPMSLISRRKQSDLFKVITCGILEHANWWNTSPIYSLRSVSAL